MTNSFPDDWNTAEPIQIETIISIKDALSGKKMKYTAIPHIDNKSGTAEGILTVVISKPWNLLQEPHQILKLMAKYCLWKIQGNTCTALTACSGT
jgi:hypothetical protein